VLLFDGVCNLCTGSVAFVLRHDRRKKFRFAALQSQAAGRLLEHCPVLPLERESVVLYQAGECYRESEAVLRLARALPWPWPALSALRIVPRAVRDAAYRIVARHRYRWFGRKSVCALSMGGHADRFLR